MGMQKKEKRIPTKVEAIVGLAIIIIVIVASMRLKTGMEIPLILGAMTAALFAFYLNFEWEEIQDAITKGISGGLVPILILLFVGMIVGIWIAGGTVPSLIYYGLNLISPKIFLPLTFILCAVTSLATGTSFGSIATIGIALFGVGSGMGIPPEMTVGAIASGAFFGDKMSPLSDTTNIASSITGTPLHRHISSMMWTTVPASIISIVLYFILGLKYSGGALDLTSIQELQNGLMGNFNISLITLVPIGIVLILSLLKVPSILTLASSAIVSSIFAMITQKIPLSQVFTVLIEGNVSDTGFEMMDKILTRGGINMMMSVIIMLIAATAMGGILERVKMLDVIVASMLNVIKTSRSLILLTMAMGYLSMAIGGNMMFGLVLVGKTFSPAYEKLNIESRVLSRTLEDVITLGNVIIPWGSAALFVQGTFGIGTEYIKYTFLSYLTPIIAIIFAFTGIGVWKKNNKRIKNGA